MDKEKAIQFKHLKELYRINPDISASDLIKLAEYYVDTCANVDDEIKNAGESVRIITLGGILTIDETLEGKGYFRGFEPKTEEEIRKHKAMEEYKQKFLADVEKLKAEKEKKYNNNEVK